MLYPRYFFSEEFLPFEKDFERHGAKRMAFRRNELLKRPTTYMDRSFYIVDGYCSVAVGHNSGNERLVGFWGRGSIYPLIINENHFFLETAITVKAVSDMTVLAMDVPCLRSALEENPEIALASIDHYGAYTNLLKFEAAAQSYEDALMRVCNILYIRYDNYLEGSIRLTQGDIASMAGLRRESVVKVLRHLREEGIIGTGPNLLVRDPDRLLALCSDMLQPG